MLKNVVTLKSGSEIAQGHWKWYHSIDWYGFLLVFYSNFVPNTRRFLRYSTCNCTVTFKPRLGSLKGIGTDTYRSATYDFLLTFHSNHGPISYRFRDIRRFQSKIAKKIPTPCILRPRWRGSSWNLVSALGFKNTRIMGVPGQEKSLTISSAIWIQYTNLTDRRTDRRTPDDSNDRAYA